MDTFEMFFQQEYWEKAYTHAIEKRIDRDLLRTYSNPEHRLDWFQEMLNDEYNIQPPRLAYIPKDDGSMREVLINTERDRIFLYIANLVYCEKYKDVLSSNCYSYKIGTTVHDAIRDIRKAMSDFNGVKIDIHHFFDEVPIEAINKFFDSEEVNPLNSVLRRHYNDNRIVIKDEVVERYKSMCQGSAFSSFLSRYILYHIDEKMKEFDVVYARYSDDMIILGNDWEKALGYITEELSLLNLNLNEKKTEYITKDSKVTFLGFELSKDEVNLSDKCVAKFKANVKKVLKPKKANAVKVYYKSLFSAFRKGGWCEYYLPSLTTTSKLKELDDFVLSRLQYCISGKWSASKNKKIKINYISLIQLYNDLQYHKDVYTARRLNLLEDVRLTYRKSERTLEELIFRYKNSVANSHYYGIPAKEVDELPELVFIQNYNRKECYNELVSYLLDMNLEFNDSYYLVVDGIVILKEEYSKWEKECKK